MRTTEQGVRVHREALTALREGRLLSKKELALEAGISLQYLCDLESGHRHGSIKVVRLLADALKCNPLALIENPNAAREAVAS